MTPTTAPTTGTVNALEAQRLLGATQWQTYHWLNTGKLKGTRQDKEWAVRVSDIERFKRDHLAALQARVAGAVALRLRANVLAAVWKDEMRAAQAAAAFAAEQFAKQYRALVAAARKGRVDPEAGEVLGERSESLIAALLRFQAANRFYAHVAIADDRAAKAEWKVAEEVKADAGDG